MQYNTRNIIDRLWSTALVQFKAPFSSTDNVLSADMVATSASGLYFNSGTHAYLSDWSNILSQLDLYNKPAFTFYDVAATYAVKAVVYEAGNYYESIQASNTGNAVTDAAFWKSATVELGKPVYSDATTYAKGDVVYNGTNYYLSTLDTNLGNALTTSAWELVHPEGIELKQMVGEAVERTLSGCLPVASLLDYGKLYAVSHITDYVANESRLAVVAFRGNCSDHLRVQINRIGLQFEQAETITFHLWNQNTELNTFALEYTNAKDLQWIDLPTGTTVDLQDNSGWYYLWYDQSLLTGRALGNSVQTSNSFSRFLTTGTFSVANTSQINDTLQRSLHHSNYGMNLDISLSFEITRAVLDLLPKMAEVIQLQWAYDMLERILLNSTNRTNRPTRAINDEVLTHDLRGTDGATFWNRLNAAKKKLTNALATIGTHEPAFQPNKKPMVWKA